MNVQDAAEGVQKAASAVQNGGAVVAVGMGGSIPVTQYLGLSLAQWQIAGVVGGLVIGFAGLVVNAYFGWRRMRLDETKAKGQA